MEVTKTEEKIKEFSERNLGKVKVLMIEDDPFITELVLEKLSIDGCVPYSANDGKVAIELAIQYQPHVIILDLMLPEVSGEMILEELKSTDNLKQIPVIVFSNKSQESDIQENMKRGAAEYFIKSSTDLNMLVATVKKFAAI